jgi:hypothetical protein
MNIINRTLIVMLLLFGIIFSCGAVFGVLFFRQQLVAALQSPLAAIGSDSLGITQLFCIGIGILVFAFSLLLLYLELMPSGKTRLKLKSIQGADVVMSSEAITSQLQFALDPLPGVIQAKPKVFKGKDDAVDVMLDMVTTPDVDVKRKTDEVMDVTRTVLEGGLGLRVGKVQIRIDQMKPPKSKVPPPKPVDLPRLVSAKQEEAAANAAKSEL